ncbi:MAG TPA: STAS domain-containing protein [Acidimicrobiales bacterium]|nr:STAS domain-containing protein [Acidimicrobiales bacterium]
MELLTTQFVGAHPSVLHIAGEIDISTADQLRTALEEALATDPKVVIDLAGVTFFDATGLRVVLQVAAAQNGAGPVTLVNAERISRVLALVGLGDMPAIVVRDAGVPDGR